MADVVTASHADESVKWSTGTYCSLLRQLGTGRSNRCCQRSQGNIAHRCTSRKILGTSLVPMPPASLPGKYIFRSSDTRQSPHLHWGTGKSNCCCPRIHHNTDSRRKDCLYLHTVQARSGVNSSLSATAKKRPRTPSTSH